MPQHRRHNPSSPARSLYAFLAALAVLAPAYAGPTEIYVDARLTPAVCSTYNAATRSCSGGTATAYNTLAGAAAAATAGQTVFIRAGTYGEPLIPRNSGVAGREITFRPYGAEVVSITGAELLPAIDISGRSYVTIRGLNIDTVRRWLLAVDAHHNLIIGNAFRHAVDPFGSSKTGLFLQASRYNRIIGNTIDDSTQDNLSLVESDRNLVEGNTITRAEHTLFTIKCGNENILRGNCFHNELQKIGEIYDCDGVGVDHDIFLYNATKYNVVERNVFDYTPSSGNSSPFAGIQYAGQNGIIRNNVFYDTVGPALDLTLYGGEAEWNTDNRVFHNVFYHSEFAGINIAPPGLNLWGNVFKNNVLTGSVFVRNDTRWNWYVELNGKPVNILTGRLDGFLFEGNDIFDQQAGETYTITYGKRDETLNPPQHSVAWWQSNYPALFAGNLELAPDFIDAANHDFHLRPTSRLIDAGVFLTRTVSAGSGTSLRVEDAGYFTDGYGIPGETGDSIRLQDDARTAHVIAIDRAAGILTLDKPLSWTGGQGVSLAYAGGRPDIGAFEFQVATCIPCDANCDGSVNQFDVQPFTRLLTPGGPAPCSACAGDANQDGTVNQFDAGPFVACLSPLQSCNPCDTNCDGSVNQQDIGAFLAQLSATPPPPCSPCAADCDGNGTVSQFDIQPFLRCLGG